MHIIQATVIQIPGLPSWQEIIWIKNNSENYKQAKHEEREEMFAVCLHYVWSDKNLFKIWI